MITDLQMPREKLEQAIYDELCVRHGHPTKNNEVLFRNRARYEADAILKEQGLLKAKKDAEARQQPYGGDIDLFGPALGRSSDARDD